MAGDRPRGEPDATSQAQSFCKCGQPLVEDADGRHVTIGERTFAFSRSTDFVLCQRCGDQIPVERLHPDPEPATAELHALSVDPDELKDQSPRP